MRALLLFILLGSGAHAGTQAKSEGRYDGPGNWNEFRQFVHVHQEEKERKGLAFMISGTLAAIGGSVGYHDSEEVFSRTVFAITSNVGIGAIGLGATYYLTGSEAQSFYSSIEGSSLSPAQKNEVLQRFLQNERRERERRKWIRVATHALLATANFISASQEDSDEVRSVFYFLGGANTVLAITYSF